MEPSRLQPRVCGVALIVVASTTAAWKCNERDELAWLLVAEKMRESSPVPVVFFCTVQMDPDPEADFPSGTLRPRLDEVGGDYWDFSLHAGWSRTTRQRLIGITTGRNLIREYALRDTDATHVLFLDSDVEPDLECISKLLELDHPVVGGDIPAYCLKGPEVMDGDDVQRNALGQIVLRRGVPRFPFPVQEHWNTAGFLLVRRDVLAEVAWRWNPDAGYSDDPCFAADVERAGFGKTWVRKDCVGKHAPLVAVERR